MSDRDRTDRRRRRTRSSRRTLSRTCTAYPMGYAVRHLLDICATPAAHPAVACVTARQGPTS
ncbi:MAG: hypothetical protein IPP00_01115 [Actinomycetales bacterium]|uniref:Uncharacterized protein n=1 Tax=Candidatus Phosphoribacter hodrii TaxID=2953743 RepID=A0A9D7T4T0_9MICO|nr:hypothetical protein [Candidatus Phosphoribacter hodrii]